LRIDAHHSGNEQYTLAYLETILKRNRFERSIYVGPVQDVPEYIAGIVAPIDSATSHPKLRGVQIGSVDDFGRAASFGLPVDLLGLLPHVPALAEAHPEATLVIDHLGHPDPPEFLEAAARFPNVYCKLSGLRRFDDPRPRVRLALGLFGPARLMFGSDWPVCRLRTEYGDWVRTVQALTAPWSQAEQGAFWGGTAANTYNLTLEI
jgi:L-fuconolactonase